MNILIYGYELFYDEMRELFSSENIVGVLESELDVAEITRYRYIKKNNIIPDYAFVVVFFKDNLDERCRELKEWYSIPENKIIHFLDYYFNYIEKISYNSNDIFPLLFEFIEKRNVKRILDYGGKIALSHTVSGSKLLSQTGICVDCIYENYDELEVNSTYNNVVDNFDYLNRYDLLLLLDVDFENDTIIRDFLNNIKGHVSYIMLSYPYYFLANTEIVNELHTLLGPGRIFLGNLYWARVAIFENNVLDCKKESHQMYVVSHKNEKPLKEDSFYKTIYVGNEQTDFSCTDNTLDNIHRYNSIINELTALYWIWKNDNHDYVGLNHYRRFFLQYNFGFEWEYNLPDVSFMSEKIKENDIIVATRWDSFPLKQRTMIIKDIGIEQGLIIEKILFEEIERVNPKSKQILEMILEGTVIYPCNMFYMSREMLNNYCEWLFSFLLRCCERIEKEIHDNEDDRKKRALGYYAERLLTVWIIQNHLKVYELDLIKL